MSATGAANQTDFIIFIRLRGQIAVTGDLVWLTDGAKLDASGASGGGSIRVGGDFHGEGATPTARRTLVESGATLSADATEKGNGGTVVVWSDEATAFYGRLTAKGGAAGGNGGQAEISGKVSPSTARSI